METANKTKTNSFVLFGRAFKNAKKDFWVSIQVLFWITIALALLFWWVEGVAQPSEYGGIFGLIQSFIWAVTRYIGDPGHFAGNGPVTLAGRWIDTSIGILKILIFAVPAVLLLTVFAKRWKMRRNFSEWRNLVYQFISASADQHNPTHGFIMKRIKRSAINM